MALVIMAWNMKKLTNKIGQFCEYQFNLKEKIAKSNFLKLNFAIFIIETVYLILMSQPFVIFASKQTSYDAKLIRKSPNLCSAICSLFCFHHARFLRFVTSSF
ncbi:hypothetical protein A3O17_00680 [Ligilactobacillus aviarius]|nr:hypothetical protein A3O17_00680 [Ligilactobacillus aviarius]